MRAMLSMGMLLFSVVASAQVGVFKWVDGNGQVHYGERPPGDARATPMELPTSSAPSQPATEDDRRERQQRLLEAFQSDREKKQEQAAQAARAAEQRKRNCAVARDRLRRLLEAGFLYKLGEDGERQVLGDAQRSAAEQGARADVQQWCN